MPRKPSILKQRGIRLPETCRPGFDRLPPEEQAAAARRDVEHYTQALAALHAGRARSEARGLPALEQRVRVLEVMLAAVLVQLEALARDVAARRDPVGRRAR